MRKMRLGAVWLAVVIGFAGAGPALAQLTSKSDEVLTPEEQAEREGRKACKVAICAAFHSKAGPEDISCSVLKSWRKEQLQKMVERAKVSWPWGRVKCVADIHLKRSDLVKATTEPTYVADIGQHQVNCEIERDKEGPAKISFAFKPKVTFAGGKATKASLNWGAIDAPTLVKGAMWTATATDNTFNVLQSTLIEDINDFIGPKCDEVKGEWAK
jgi:hypothetical protein